MRWDELLDGQVEKPTRSQIERMESIIEYLAPGAEGTFRAFIDCLLEAGVKAPIILAALRDADRYFGLPIFERSGRRAERRVRDALREAEAKP